MRITKKLFLVAIIILVLMPCFAFAQKRVVVLTLKDASRYSGRWNIGGGVTELMVNALNEHEEYSAEMKVMMLSGAGDRKDVYDDKTKLLMLGREYNADYIITGVIRKFSVSTYGIISPSIGGVKHYRSTVEIELRVVNVGAQTMRSLIPKGDKNDTDLGFTILGGPGGSSDLDDITLMESYEIIRFGSEVYKEQTLIGQATMACVNDFMKRFTGDGSDVDGLPDGETSVSIAPKVVIRVLTIDDEYVTINAGSSIGLKEGSRLTIFREGDPIVDPDTGEVYGRPEIEVATIEIAFVKGPKFSQAKIIETKRDILAGDTVRILPENENDTADE